MLIKVANNQIAINRDSMNPIEYELFHMIDGLASKIMCLRSVKLMESTGSTLTVMADTDDLYKIILILAEHCDLEII